MIDLKFLAKIPEELSLIAAILPKIQAALPQIQKTLLDIKQASDDRQDPVKLVVDLNVLLSDFGTDLNALIALFPPPNA